MDMIYNGELFLVNPNVSINDVSLIFVNNRYIYQLRVSENGPEIRQRNENGEMGSFTKTNFDSIYKSFVPLFEFLNNAQYIGRDCIFDVSIPTPFNSQYQDSYTYESMLLYKGDNYIITYDERNRDVFNKKIPIKILETKYIKGYKIIGNYYNDIYSNPQKLYEDIFNEILDDTKDKNQKK